MKIIGIDPGQRGGMAVFEDENIIELIIMPTYTVIKSNKKKKEMVDFTIISNLFKRHNPKIVYIEKVSAMPKNGCVSMFNFAWSVSGIYGICAALEIPIVAVGPKTWQETLMGKKPKGEHREKEETIQFVQNKWSNVSLLATPRSKKPHDGLSDSIAIGYYGFLEETKKNIINIINKEG